MTRKITTSAKETKNSPPRVNLTSKKPKKKREINVRKIS